MVIKLSRKHKKIANRIARSKTELTHHLNKNKGLREDFEFFIEKLNWTERKLIAHLYWNCGRFTSQYRSTLGAADNEYWKNRRKVLEKLPENLFKICDEIQKLNNDGPTSLSPAKMPLTYDIHKRRDLTEPERKRSSENFFKLPEVLRDWSRTLCWKMEMKKRFDEGELKELVKADMQEPIPIMIEDIILSEIGKYHSTRLWRLLNAASKSLGLGRITKRSFEIRLNRRKKALNHSSR